MKTEPVKIKVTSIGNMVTTPQMHGPDYKLLPFTFIELAADSPTGRYREDGPPVLAECHNDNILDLQPTAGEIYWATFSLFHSKRNNGVATSETRYLVLTLKPIH